eukprot:133274-Alexandrium_andersonii.AAC.1
MALLVGRRQEALHVLGQGGCATARAAQNAGVPRAGHVIHDRPTQDGVVPGDAGALGAPGRVATAWAGLPTSTSPLRAEVKTAVAGPDCQAVPGFAWAPGQ